MRGRSVTWYNCGPTVYDASHMGHARNYVTQDIIRRLLRDYFSYDVTLIQNVTDIDDKIIIGARHAYLVQQFRGQHAVPSRELLDTVREAWGVYFGRTLSRFAPPPAAQEQAPSDEARWEEVVRLWQTDAAWKAKVVEAEPKAAMWFNALNSSRQAQVAAAMAVAGGSKDAALAAQLVDASADVLAPHLDASLGHTVTDPSVFRKLAAYWEARFYDDMARLHVERPTLSTRVTEYVPEIVTFTQKIVENGYAYEDPSPGNGKMNVWFDTRAFDGGKKSGEAEAHSYAKLAPWSKGDTSLLEEGEGSLSTGASTVAGKRGPSDFALWKTSKPGEPAWDSPWGPGRPGWHIECSVMASEILGKQIDIHSGGVDLMFPHHDNELAQSEAFHQCGQWINYFLHTGHLHIEGLKMSKSLKNFISIDEALQRFSPRRLRLAFLLQSWSAKMDFRESAMAEVKGVESTLNNFFASVRSHVREDRARGEAWSDGNHHYGTAEAQLFTALQDAQLAFRRAMCDSFDTPRGMSVLLDLVSKANVYERAASKGVLNIAVLVAVARWVGDMLRVFGLGEGPVREGDLGWGEEAVAGDASGGGDREEVVMPYLKALSNFRDAVRALAREGAPHTELLKLADRLRDIDMVDLGVAMEDNESGQAMLKLVPAAQLQAARAEKEAQQAEKAARKAEAAEKARAARIEKLQKGSVPPSELFRTDEYGSWDERGLPLTMRDGEEVAKKRRKNCEKELERQVKLHQEWQAARDAGEI
ncbi:hypothetical protein FA09DRAFT_308177 [Tilletiopsis washingtonensis]|uniref:cysteine--tRNA ligase n=1 Tax=Tilletiopsis washingtonensis TaxID=58919 RepID=A0A316ZDF2_9BASI|nr:hypothetical protein FA09DRAFT_308177 [Tilletiopsis washingtonensis]PWN98315.1 hypothetical protein FA09DRAFT_308177 [Tilletiopsis washingtonensis]